MKAIVFAAGKGVRLEPLTSGRPKHLLPVAGAPLIEHTLRSLKAAGVRDLLIIDHYLKEQIEAYLGDGSRLGLRLNYIDQGGIFGTCHALGLGREFVGRKPFLVVYGDIAFHPSLPRSILKAFRSGMDGIVTGVNLPDSSAYGMIRSEHGFVKGITEKPSKGGPGTINGGVYIFKPEIFDFVARTGKSERGESELTTTINMAVKGGLKMGVCPLKSEHWVDVGRPWDLLEANRMLMDNLPGEGLIEGLLEKCVQVRGKIHVESGASLLSGTYLEGPIWISAGCRIGPNCHIRPYSYLCRGVRVGNGCEIKGSILMEGSHVGHLSYVGDSVLGERTNLGAGTITANLRFDDQPVAMKIGGESIMSSRRKLGAFLGDRVKTGINVSLFPGVKVGQDSWVAPHVVLHSDVPPRTLVTQKFQLEMRQRR